jgi:hypothetical protein
LQRRWSTSKPRLMSSIERTSSLAPFNASSLSDALPYVPPLSFAPLAAPSSLTLPRSAVTLRRVVVSRWSSYL